MSDEYCPECGCIDPELTECCMCEKPICDSSHCLDKHMMEVHGNPEFFLVEPEAPQTLGDA